MTQDNPTNVFAAFEILLEEIETEIDLINKVGAGAFERRDYDSVKEAIERADRATTLRDNIASLRNELSELELASTEAGLLWLEECLRTVKLGEEIEDELVGEGL